MGGLCGMSNQLDVKLGEEIVLRLGLLQSFTHSEITITLINQTIPLILLIPDVNQLFNIF